MKNEKINSAPQSQIDMMNKLDERLAQFDVIGTALVTEAKTLVPELRIDLAFEVERRHLARIMSKRVA